MGVLLSLEIGQILCACPCLSLSQGDPAKSNKQRESVLSAPVITLKLV